ncbi:MAG: SDR family oxidoreductase [Gammaproteobacteria bacterium]|nr:SDR family oxidoreductase [Gammaproteobacteria bacterium]MBK7170603.1 SDR family oxidoreductase [Gammaproteobacteria bacterium]MBK7729991.1 SDR family oxidoreductase [Gammaproteobacteria bacterium]MBP6052397.1 SDR family oxidoreductase [Pseudomonadales bacterium]
MRGLKDKVVVIAGGGAIGTATVERLAQAGARIVLGDLDGAHAAEVADRICAGGADCMGMQFDIADEASVATLVACAVERHGGIDALYANAADLSIIHQDSDVLGEPLAVFDQTIRVNLRGHWLCTRAVLPELLRRGGGSLVYTSSGAACMGEPVRPAYAVSKAGIEALMRHVASNWGKQRIRANAVAPGLVLTPAIVADMPAEFQQFALKGARSWRLGEPADIASMVAFLCSDEAQWITGQVLGVNGGAVLG